MAAKKAAKHMTLDAICKRILHSPVEPRHQGNVADKMIAAALKAGARRVS